MCRAFSACLYMLCAPRLFYVAYTYGQCASADPCIFFERCADAHSSYVVWALSWDALAPDGARFSRSCCAAHVFSKRLCCLFPVVTRVVAQLMQGRTVRQVGGARGLACAQSLRAAHVLVAQSTSSRRF